MATLINTEISRQRNNQLLKTTIVFCLIKLAGNTRRSINSSMSYIDSCRVARSRKGKLPWKLDCRCYDNSTPKLMEVQPVALINQYCLSTINVSYKYFLFRIIYNLTYKS